MQISIIEDDNIEDLENFDVPEGKLAIFIHISNFLQNL